MNRSNLHSQQLLCMKQMAQICLTIQGIYTRSTIGFNRGEVRLPFFITHIHDAVFREQHSVAPVACRHHTIEHIDSSLNTFENINRCTDSH